MRLTTVPETPLTLRCHNPYSNNPVILSNPEAERLEDLLAKKNKTISLLQVDIQALLHQQEKLEKDLQEAIENNAALHDTKEKNIDLENKNTDLRSKNANLERENTHLKTQLLSLTKEKEAAETLLSQFKKQRSDLMTKLNQLKEKHKGAEAAQEIERKTIHKKEQALNDKIASLKNALKQKESDYQAQLEKNTSSKTDYALAKAMLSEPKSLESFFQIMLVGIQHIKTIIDTAYLYEVFYQYAQTFWKTHKKSLREEAMLYATMIQMGISDTASAFQTAALFFFRTLESAGGNKKLSVSQRYLICYLLDYTAQEMKEVTQKSTQSIYLTFGAGESEMDDAQSKADLGNTRYYSIVRKSEPEEKHFFGKIAFWCHNLFDCILMMEKLVENDPHLIAARVLYDELLPRFFVSFPLKFSFSEKYICCTEIQKKIEEILRPPFDKKFPEPFITVMQEKLTEMRTMFVDLAQAMKQDNAKERYLLDFYKAGFFHPALPTLSFAAQQQAIAQPAGYNR